MENRPLRRGAAVCAEHQPQRVRLSNRVKGIPKRRLLARVSATGLGGTVALQETHRPPNGQRPTKPN